MERLSIREVIEHCNRNTEITEMHLKRERLESMSMEDTFIKRYWEHRQVAEWLEELQVFKGKQEEGLLLELPCKVGDTVWFIQKTSGKPKLIETEIEKIVLKKSGLYVKLSCNSFYETTCNSIGNTVFFTRSEAESALAKMGGK